MVKGAGVVIRRPWVEALHPPVQNFCQDLAEITKISVRLPRSHQDFFNYRDLSKIAKISPRSRQDFAEIFLITEITGISVRLPRFGRILRVPRSGRDINQELGDTTQITTVVISLGLLRIFYEKYFEEIANIANPISLAIST